MNDVKREIDITSRLAHVNVVRTYEVFDEPERIWLVMDHCKGGDLFDRAQTGFEPVPVFTSDVQTVLLRAA